MVISPRFDEPSEFYEGLATVKIKKKWGYVDKKGDFIIPPEFEMARGFRNGLAKVMVNRKLGYINKKGNYVWKSEKPVDRESFWIG